MGLIGENVWLVEYGSGSSRKTKILLDRFKNLAGYVPIDISEEHLLASASELRERYPNLKIHPICADYTRPLKLPDFVTSNPKRCIFFPGSTIGNFHPSEAKEFLHQMALMAGEQGNVLIGVDLRKEPSVLENAYDDSQGVTAAFNRNVLLRLNQEYDSNFDLDHFKHEARWNTKDSRVEMHLVSTRPQTVTFLGEQISFKQGESIWTESSYKYTLESFAQLAIQSGLEVKKSWTDKRELFSVHCLQPASS